MITKMVNSLNQNLATIINILFDSISGTNKPQCGQLYNLFHPTDPTAARLEPLLSARFSMLAPVNVPRYGEFSKIFILLY